MRDLERRGLEIRFTTDYGSHKKYYPYCSAGPEIRDDDLALVTADDDVLYPVGWLDELVKAAETESAPAIVAHRGHMMKIANGMALPYLDWALGRASVMSSLANVATGVGGVLYPTQFVSQVTRVWGSDFLTAAPTADDLWLHSRSVLLGIRTRQVSAQPLNIVEHHYSMNDSLAVTNVVGGLNDAVIQRLYTPEMISRISADRICD